MKTFLIKTEVKFTNVYFVDAETKEEAEDLVVNGDHDYLQRFEGEEVLNTEEDFDPAYVIIDLKAEGFH